MTQVEKNNRREIYLNLTAQERKIVTSLAIKKAVTKDLTVDDVAKMFIAQRSEQCLNSEELHESIRKFKGILES